MVKDHYKAGGSEGFDKDKWRVFVLCKFDGNIDLKSGTNILQYEASLTMHILPLNNVLLILLTLF